MAKKSNKAKTIKASYLGVEFELNRSCLSDADTLMSFFELQELMDDYNSGAVEEIELLKASLTLPVRLFGKKQWNRIKEELRHIDSDEPHFALCAGFSFGALEAAADKLGVDIKNS